MPRSWTPLRSLSLLIVRCRGVQDAIEVCVMLENIDVCTGRAAEVGVFGDVGCDPSHRSIFKTPLIRMQAEGSLTEARAAEQAYNPPRWTDMLEASQRAKRHAATGEP